MDRLYLGQKKFLFHTGAIKRTIQGSLLQKRVIFSMFLFHTGAIKSLEKTENRDDYGWSGFYSILVRLKALDRDACTCDRKTSGSVSIPYWCD